MFLERSQPERETRTKADEARIEADRFEAEAKRCAEMFVKTGLHGWLRRRESALIDCRKWRTESLRREVGHVA